jgi:hypothetical protein
MPVYEFEIHVTPRVAHTASVLSFYAADGQPPATQMVHIRSQRP